MIKLTKIKKGEEPEPFYRLEKKFKEKRNIFDISGLKKLDYLCTVIALTQDFKHILNTDSCDYYQFEKFNKQDILDMIDDLVEIANKMK